MQALKQLIQLNRMYNETSNDAWKATFESLIDSTLCLLSSDNPANLKELSYEFLS